MKNRNFQTSRNPFSTPSPMPPCRRSASPTSPATASPATGTAAATGAGRSAHCGTSDGWNDAGTRVPPSCALGTPPNMTCQHFMSWGLMCATLTWLTIGANWRETQVEIVDNCERQTHPMYAAWGFRQEISFLSACVFRDSQQKDVVAGFNPSQDYLSYLPSLKSKSIDLESRTGKYSSNPSWQGLSIFRGGW